MGTHANAAIFAADGAARHRLMKAAGAASFALLAAWLIALALGVWGGFGSLPGLPSSHSTRPSEASSKTDHHPPPAPAQSQRSAGAVRTASPSPTDSRSHTGSGTGSGGVGTTTHSQSSNLKAAALQPVKPTSTSSAPPSTSHGQGITPTTGKPSGSPGNGPGGSGAPGQLR